jgi:hypothetical protein
MANSEVKNKRKVLKNISGHRVKSLFLLHCKLVRVMSEKGSYLMQKKIILSMI